MGRGSSKIGGGGGGSTDPLAKYENSSFKPSYAKDIKAGDTLTDRVVNTSTGENERIKWNIDKDGLKFTDFIWSDLKVTSIKVSGKTTKITGKSVSSGNTVTKTFKNDAIIQKRKS